MTKALPIIGLDVHALFDDRPTAEFLDGWRRHIDSTGHPETYPTVTNAGPTMKSGVVVLSEEITVPVHLRLNGRRVPCPLCTPGHEKFEVGRMIWFVDEKVVRFVGRDCAQSRLGEDYKLADKRFSFENRMGEYLRRWKEIYPRAAELKVILDSLRSQARFLQCIAEQLDQYAPSFRGNMFRELSQNAGTIMVKDDVGKDRTGQTIMKPRELGKAQGLWLMQPDFMPEPLYLGLRKLVESMEEPPVWRVDMRNTPAKLDAETKLLSEGREIYQIPRRLMDLWAMVADAQLFLKADHLAMLEQYGNEYSHCSPFANMVLRIEDGHLKVNGHTYGQHQVARIIVHADARKPVPAVPDWLQAMALNSLTTRRK
ncbi:hypothetical protein [Oryzicola mucosus]|uniref:Uncharacterized protein n=1 Tax=Oryzicola mucosus TaxID=2767425 RepID=A0A8J6PL82_9HYPH|nr:hypothetical protein [Oryzicola mucosus]MBD0416523.1 hypothetical protein [Oryzicola mucosus]